MLDRRDLLLGSAPLALFLASPPARAEDPGSVHVQARVRALWGEKQRRAEVIRAEAQRRAALDANPEVIDQLAEGVAWVGLAWACAREEAADLAHPAYQALLRAAAVAIGEAMGTLASLLDGLAARPVDESAFRVTLDGLTAALLGQPEEPTSRAVLAGTSRRLDRTLDQHGVAGVLSRHRRELSRLLAAAGATAAVTAGAPASTDPALRSQAAEARDHWEGLQGGRAVEPAPRGLSFWGTLGVMVLGLVLAGGTLLFATGAWTSLTCASLGIPMMLIGLTGALLAGAGVAAIVNPGPHLLVASVQQSAWVPCPLPTSGWRWGRLWAGGLVPVAQYAVLAGHRGRAHTVAGEGAPYPAGRLGALVGRLAGRDGDPPEVFHAMDAVLRLSPTLQLELAINLRPPPGEQRPGFRVHLAVLD